MHLFVPAEDGEFESFLHEDDGLTLAFERGAFLRTSFIVKRKGHELTLTASVSGSGFAELARRSLRLVFHGQIATQVSLDGRRSSSGLTDNTFDFANNGQGFRIEAELGEQ